MGEKLIPEKKLREWRKGDVITAARLQEMQRRIGFAEHTPPDFGALSDRVSFIRLGEVVGPETSSSFRERSGTHRYYHESGQNWIDYDETAQGIVTAERLPYDQDEFVPCISHNGKWVPLSARTVRPAITWLDDDDEYPSPGERPDTYPIKFVRVSYREQKGRQGHSLTYFQPDDPGPDGFAHNLFDEWTNDLDECADTDLCESPYLPLGILIWVFNCIGRNGDPQWFTYCCCWPEEESSQSSSQSSQSTSSQSTSSQSTSSQSQESTSSQSSSSISQSTGSSSSGESEGSLSESSGTDLIEVVTDVSCDSNDDIAICTRTMVFDAEGHLNYVTDEECP